MLISQKKWKETVRPTTEWYKQQREAAYFRKRNRPKPVVFPWMIAGMKKNQRHFT